MIIVEDKLKEMFGYLPDMSYAEGATEFTPVFGYGDQKELNLFLAERESKTSKPYPLIWLLYPYKEKHFKREVLIEDLVLLLAVDTTEAMRYKDRIETTFGRILIPLFDNINTVFNRAINVNKKDEVGVVKFPNYTDDSDRYNDNLHFTSDRWDALKTTWEIKINDNCLKKIKV